MIHHISDMLASKAIREAALEIRTWVCGALVCGLVASCSLTPEAEETWQPIFDGETLAGWTPKISGQALGEDERSIFRVEDGALKVSYDGYDKFGGEFGHLFYAERLANYQLRFEYRFAADRTPGGPGWAFMNSGVMVHSQAPETMRIDQNFPISIEAQLLGKGPDQDTRTTANVCTPGTDVVIDGTFTKTHCINSQTQAFAAGEWVSFEITVQNGELVRQSINGVEAFLLTAPSFDETDADVTRLGLSGLVTDGYISLQAESHALAFRNIELKRLD